ncbi:MAG: hypothetical protein HZC36_11925 [Armatimonadetes bacterium]|nr:hypothetical protein [Armatimonadota bacterium]
MFQPRPRSIAALAAIAILTISVQAQQAIDEGYTKKILEYTTEKFFLTEFVDHLPASKTVPTPEKVLGYVIGTPKVLTYAEDCARYLRELEKASPRVKVFSMGKSEEGREMVVAAISDEANLARLARLKEINGLLGDPRKLKTQDEAEKLLKEGVPFYWATGGLHSPETGPPETLMELAYRLAVDESPFFETIRKNSVILITPVIETDGRNRIVDLNKWRNANPGKRQPPTVYWGKYVAHDNNRDGIGLGLALSQNIMKTWLDFKPTVFHDLHESVPFLYISTGTGPYNAWLDPIVVNEWQILAYNEINEMTKRGVPGVWTHDFFDGWAPNYAFYCANGHNAIGRFYETFSGGWADTGIRQVGSQSQRAWFRPNPPFPEVRWSIRNNVNIMQSALLIGMNKVAGEHELFLRNYYLKSKRSIAKATTEGPAAYVLPASDKRKANQLAIVRILQAQGIEVHRLDKDADSADGKFGKGSYVVRMDQPYSRMADMLLDSQYYSSKDPRSYDDTGWQLGPLFNVATVRCKDVKVLDGTMALVPAVPEVSVAITPANTVRPVSFVLKNGADIGFIRLKATMPAVELMRATAEFKNKEEGEVTYPAGTLIAKFPEGADAETNRQKLASSVGIDMAPLAASGDLQTVPMAMPRIALVHTWANTQSDGWYRLAFDQLGIKYDYISVHDIRDTADLKSKYDVLLLTSASGSAQSLVNGLPKIGDPIPWKATDAYPNLGGPASSDDIRGGIELAGMVNLQRFVTDGGMLICTGAWCRVPIDYGIVSGIGYQTDVTVNAPGGVFLAENANKSHPVMSGYDDTVGVYFNANSCVVLTTGGGGGFGGRGGPGAASGERPSGRGGKNDPDVVQGRPPYKPVLQPGDETPTPQIADPNRPQVLLRFSTADKLLVSGMVDMPEELAGRPLLVDCPVGKGHVMLFSFNPMWRGETVGSYAFIFNAAMNWNTMGGK